MKNYCGGKGYLPFLRDTVRAICQGKEFTRLANR
jgi:hypothetical protein